MGVNLAERSRRRDLRFGLMLIAPAVLIIVMLLGYPMGYAVFMSFHEWNDKLGMEHPFIGLDNYGQLLTDPAVHRAMERTAYFSVITVIGGVALAVAIAVLLNREFRGRTLARVLLLVPWAVPPVVNGIMWKLIFDGSTGVANTILRGLGPHGPERAVAFRSGDRDEHPGVRGDVEAAAVPLPPDARGPPGHPVEPLPCGGDRRRGAVARVLAHHAAEHAGRADVRPHRAVHVVVEGLRHHLRAHRRIRRAGGGHDHHQLPRPTW